MMLRAWPFLLTRAGPVLALALLAGSVTAGLLFMLLPALGYLPALGGDTITWRVLALTLSDPRLPGSLISTLTAGIISTLLSLLLALGLASALDGTKRGAIWVQHLATAILAMPHAALALGLAFLLAPSGWLVRGIHAATGWFLQPPDVALIQDPHALALTLALVVKETPFLFVAMVTALGQIPVSTTLRATTTLGYGRHIAWVKVILPQLYPLVRFPILAVLAYGLSVVDMSLILGPANPATWPVLILRAAYDPDLAQRFAAAAGALLQLALVVGALLCWWGGERLLAALLRSWSVAGVRDWPRAWSRLGGWSLSLCACLGLIVVALALLSLAAWSVATTWHYPTLWPDNVTLANWQRATGGLWQPVLNSIALAIVAAVLAIVQAIACLEHEKVLSVATIRRAEKWLFLPLLVPDISFLIGIQVLLLLLGLNGTWASVLWLHLLFVFPYVFLTLKEPWRQFDPRYEQIARALGKTAWQTLWRVKLPLLIGPLTWSAAIGAAVSMTLYLPTVLAGEGRVVTLASEAIALSASGDRRIAAVFGLAQAVIIAALFLAALAMARRRRYAS